MKAASMRKAACLLVAALGLGGCAHHNTLYAWGGYDGLLYQSYKDPTKTAVLLTKLETHVLALEQGGAKVAPGLYAEVGTLYLQIGKADKATVYYTKERDAWPESRPLMDTLIAHVSDRKPVAPKAEMPAASTATEVKS